MSDEARIQCGLQIRKTSGAYTQIDYRSGPSTFQADVTGTKGPTPGAVTARTTGTVVDLSQLTIPGLVFIHNLDDSASNYVEWGIYDPQTDVFYPIGELMAGESTVFRFSRNLLEEYTGTGTGTTAATNQFMLKSFNATAVVTVEAFEK